MKCSSEFISGHWQFRLSALIVRSPVTVRSALLTGSDSFSLPHACFICLCDGLPDEAIHLGNVSSICWLSAGCPHCRWRIAAFYSCVIHHLDYPNNNKLVLYQFRQRTNMGTWVGQSYTFTIYSDSNLYYRFATYGPLHVPFWVQTSDTRINYQYIAYLPLFRLLLTCFCM